MREEREAAAAARVRERVEQLKHQVGLEDERSTPRCQAESQAVLQCLQATGDLAACSKPVDVFARCAEEGLHQRVAARK